MNTIKRLKLSVQQHYEHNIEAKKLVYSSIMNTVKMPRNLV